MKSLALVAVTWPELTTSAKAASLATSQRSFVGSPMPEPGVASGDGFTRVQMMTALAVGSPDATP